MKSDAKTPEECIAAVEETRRADEQGYVAERYGERLPEADIGKS